MEALGSSAPLLGKDLRDQRTSSTPGCGGLAPHRPGWPASRWLLGVFKGNCPDVNLLPPKPIRTPETGNLWKCKAQSELPTAGPGRAVCVVGASVETAIHLRGSRPSPPTERKEPGSHATGFRDHRVHLDVPRTPGEQGCIYRHCKDR